MTDLDLLTGALAVRIGELAGVVRLQGRRLGRPVRAATDVLAALSGDRGVDARPADGGLEIRVDVAVSDAVPAPATARAIADLVREALEREGAPLGLVRVRIVSVEEDDLR